MMALTQERLRQWHDRRARRIGGIGWLRRETVPGGKPAWYAEGELLVLADHRRVAERTLGELGQADQVQESEVAPGLLRYRAPVGALDVPAATRAMRRAIVAQGDQRPAVGPNHVFRSTVFEGTPFEHGGPCGPPLPATRPRGARRGPRDGGEVAVAVVDTGVWRDSPLPKSAYTAAESDYEADTDVDNDGVIDGDVGHANFIIGVVAAQTRNADIRAMRVLDTFGVCTEADLVVALSRIADEKLVNLSLGGFTLDDEPPLALAHTLSTLLAGRERLVVAAAGNDGQWGRPFWPAAFAGTGLTWANQVVAVAAHDGREVCTWSNSGDWVTLAAPGADITSTFVRHERFPSGWALWSGTSFATPHVVGWLAKRLAAGGTVDDALRALREESRRHTFSAYPGLP